MAPGGPKMTEPPGPALSPWGRSVCGPSPGTSSEVLPTHLPVTCPSLFAFMFVHSSVSIHQSVCLRPSQQLQLSLYLSHLLPFCNSVCRLFLSVSLCPSVFVSLPPFSARGL